MINILEYFDDTVRKYPDRIAIIDGDRQMTFEELNYLVNCYSFSLKKYHNKPIAVLLPKFECIIADLAIIRSGNFYMNLDVKSPKARIDNILNEIKPALVISDLNNITGDIEFNEVTNIDTDPLCIINTSGSTGTPKGVVLNHRSFINFTEWAYDTFSFENEIIGSLSPVVFDIFSFELCMMMRGSTIKILPDATFPADLLNAMVDITFIFWVPTIMVNIANMDLLSRIHLNLKTVWFAGEVFPTKQFNYWRKHLPVLYVNLYGPIEITLDCTYFIVDRELKDDEPIPIGRPCRNTDILILDKDELSDEGELCVRGTSLAMGYYNNPKKTSEVFVQNPLNTSYPEIIYRTGDYVSTNERGELIFKGRRDTMIKHLGYRIELAEIEHTIINVLKLVDNGCAVYNKEIVFYYESSKEIKRSEIISVLPKYMIPTKFIRMDQLPRNINGKIDRLMLCNL